MLMFPKLFAFLKFNLGVKNLVKFEKMKIKIILRIQNDLGPIVQ